MKIVIAEAAAAGNNRIIFVVVNKMRSKIRGSSCCYCCSCSRCGCCFSWASRSRDYQKCRARQRGGSTERYQVVPAAHCHCHVASHKDLRRRRRGVRMMVVHDVHDVHDMRYLLHLDRRSSVCIVHVCVGMKNANKVVL